MQLYCGDCLDVLKTLEAGSVDAVITDPPYNVGLDYASTDDRRADYAEWCALWFAELRRVSRGPIAISCGVGNLTDWNAVAKPDWVLAWVKRNSMKRVCVGWNTWEPVLIYGKVKGKKTHDSFLVSIAPQKDTGDHPCPKPINWAREILDRLTVAGATVLDPFMGSGTTGVAALQECRNFIGIELDPGYFAIAQRRIEQAQPALLTGAAA